MRCQKRRYIEVKGSSGIDEGRNRGRTSDVVVGQKELSENALIQSLWEEVAVRIPVKNHSAVTLETNRVPHSSR